MDGRQVRERSSAMFVSPSPPMMCQLQLSVRYDSSQSGCMQERTFRKRVDADGEVGGMRTARLSEFLDASLRSQQAVRRAMRGTATALRL